jgi:hypothetical protein
MPLPPIISIPPGEPGWKEFLFNHARDHDEIRLKIQSLFHINLPTYVLDPVLKDDFQGFLERHQQAHNDFNGVLNLNGTDLTGMNPDKPSELHAWLWLNFSEHQNARGVLGI